MKKHRLIKHLSCQLKSDSASNLLKANTLSQLFFRFLHVLHYCLATGVMSHIHYSNEVSYQAKIRRMWKNAFYHAFLTSYWSTLVPALVRGSTPHQNITITVGVENYNGVATRWWKKFHNIFSYFNAIIACDRQTDRCLVTLQSVLCICMVRWKWLHISMFKLASCK